MIENSTWDGSPASADSIKTKNTFDSDSQSSGCINLFKKYVVIFGIALTIVGCRMAVEFSVNGLHRQSRLKIYQEKIAEPGFKPSVLRNSPNSAYRTLVWKKKGIPYTYLFKEGQWLQKSIASFSGVYGWLIFRAPILYYAIRAVIYFLFFALIALQVAVKGNFSDRIFLLITFGCIFLNITASTLNSWLVDFQPQGRYLFPILMMIALLLHLGANSIKNVPIVAFFFITTVFSFYSFIFVYLIPVIRGG